MCRSFSFTRKTRECRLSDKNSLMINPRPFRKADYYELSYYLGERFFIYYMTRQHIEYIKTVFFSYEENENVSDQYNRIPNSAHNIPNNEGA